MLNCDGTCGDRHSRRYPNQMNSNEIARIGVCEEGYATQQRSRNLGAWSGRSRWRIGRGRGGGGGGGGLSREINVMN